MVKTTGHIVCVCKKTKLFSKEDVLFCITTSNKSFNCSASLSIFVLSVWYYCCLFFIFFVLKFNSSIFLDELHFISYPRTFCLKHGHSHFLLCLLLKISGFTFTVVSLTWSKQQTPWKSTYTWLYLRTWLRPVFLFLDYFVDWNDWISLTLKWLNHSQIKRDYILELEQLLEVIWSLIPQRAEFRHRKVK